MLKFQTPVLNDEFCRAMTDGQTNKNKDDQTKGNNDQNLQVKHLCNCYLPWLFINQ